MFEGILKAFKKRLEASEFEAKTPECPKKALATKEEIEEFDILSYVEKHGVEDKDSEALLPEKTSGNNSFKKLKQQKKSPATVEHVDFEERPKVSQSDKDGRDEILNYVERFGTYNKDATGTGGKSSQKEGSVYKVKRAMEKRVDLHGLTVDEAEQLLRSLLHDARRVGITQLLIVHGRGMHSRSNGGEDVLRQRVRELLTREFSHLIESFKYAPGSEGGDGATRVFLK